MRTAFFSTRPYEREAFEAALAEPGAPAHEVAYLEPRLTAATAALAEGCDAACLFVNDRADAPALERLARGGVRLVALRSAGYNHVDLAAAERLGITVARVPAYSPHAVAEHAAALLLALVRRLPRAVTRVRDGNFSLDGLVGFDLHGKTVGVVGTGEIGAVFARIMTGFGCRVIAFDPVESDACLALGVAYVPLDALLAESDVVALHCPLTPATHHLLDEGAFARMRPGVVVVNTSRGAVIDTRAAIAALKGGRLGGLGLDVYEGEAGLFFADRSAEVIRDDVFARLLTFPNVVVTGHQAFLTREALAAIARTTLGNLTAFAGGGGTLHRVPPPRA
jgi:D-lactate dehydrogenase